MLPSPMPMRFDHSISFISGTPNTPQYSGLYENVNFCPAFSIGTDTSDVASWRFRSGGACKFSIAFWIKPEGQEYFSEIFNNDYLGRYHKKQVIIDNLGAADDDGFEIYLEGNGSYTDALGSSVAGVNNKVTFKLGSVSVSSDPSVVDFANDLTNSSLTDCWRHVICTYDSSLGSNNMKIYINGLLHNQANCTTLPDVTTMPFIGRNSAKTTSSNMTVTSTSYADSLTTVTGTKGCFGNTSPATVTIAGTSNNDGDKVLQDSTLTSFTFTNSGGSAGENESGLSGATATVEHYHSVVNLKIGDMQIWDDTISDLEARLVWWIVASPRAHINWNRFNTGHPYFPIITNPQKLFAWYRFGDGIEYVNYGTGSNQAVVHNMSRATTISGGSQRNLYSNILYGQSENPDLDHLKWPVSLADSPCDAGANHG